MRKSVATVATAAFLALAGCTSTSAPEAPQGSAQQNAVVQQLGFSGKSTQQIIEAIDSSPDARPLGFGASVRGSELVLTKDDQEAKLGLPDGLFYLSVAPYRTHTHECYNHSLATCKGELANEDVTVRIVDDQGKVLVDRQAKTYANGFVGTWLPRDVRGTVTVTHDGVRGSAPFATTEGSPSCMTTLRLTEKV
ncbi:MAG: CueP family metal-binding protein [Intrasporangium sp.]|uniref:CueP family metal-binding protein n=1 Tax=Intrasporangium sp. TaxID=1925024 RepID=UPI003F820CD8